MLKENWRLISRVEKLADLAITFVAFYAAYYIRELAFKLNQKLDLGLPFNNQVLAPIQDYLIILIITIFTLGITLHILNAYGSMRLTTSWRLIQLFSLSSFFVFISIAAILFIFKIDISRSFIALFCVNLTLLLTLERIVVLKLLRYWRKQGYNYRNIIVCGLSKQALRLAEEIAARPELGIRIRCYADLKPSAGKIEDFKAALKAPRARVIQDINAIESALEEYAIDEIIFTDISNSLKDTEEVMLLAAEQGVRTTIAADLFSIGLVKSGLSYFGNIPLIHFQTPPGDRWDLAVKRIFDVLVSAILLVLISPLMLLIAVLIKLTSPGAFFFVQKRVGLNGHLFNMYKFRSMQIDAEEKLAELKQSNEMQGPAFKLADDPRITPLGKFLRKHSLDELPQLWNVLLGDMSLVGPRPPIPGEVNSYERRYRRRLSMRPGLTCTWQVSGRNKINNFEDWVKLDLDYIDNWSLGRDFALLIKTIPTVILGTGAN